MMEHNWHYVIGPMSRFPNRVRTLSFDHCGWHARWHATTSTATSRVWLVGWNSQALGHKNTHVLTMRLQGLGIKTNGPQITGAEELRELSHPLRLHEGTESTVAESADFRLPFSLLGR